LILVDANVFMYAAGAAHEYKEPSLQFLSRIAERRIEPT
jgi:predicted nucleic acid-binding protein